MIPVKSTPAMTRKSHAGVLDSGPLAMGALESLGAEMGVLGRCLAAERCGLGSEGWERLGGF